MTTDPSTDIRFSAFKDIIVKFCNCSFREETIGHSRLAWVFAFIKNSQGDKRPVVAGEVLRKTADKAMAIDFRLSWKEAGGNSNMG